jgi:hypothetical protein
VAAHHGRLSWFKWQTDVAAHRAAGNRAEIRRKIENLSHLFGYFFGKQTRFGFARFVIAFARFRRFQTFGGFATAFCGAGGQSKGGAQEEKQEGEQTELSHEYSERSVNDCISLRSTKLKAQNYRVGGCSNNFPNL